MFYTLARDTLARQRRLKKIYTPPKNETGELVATCMEKAEVLSDFFLARFSMVISLYTPLKPLIFKARTEGMKVLPS